MENPIEFAIQEFHRGLDRLWHKHILSRSVYPDTRFALFGNGSTDGSGNLVMQVGGANEIPDGKTFFLYKLIQWADSYTPAAPYTGTTCSTYILRGNNSQGGTPPVTQVADFAPNVGAGGTVQTFPLTAEYNSKTAPEFRANDSLYFQVVSGPVSKNIFIAAYGELLSNRQIQTAATETEV